MKLVIDIPDDDYNVILENANFYIEKHWGLPTVWDAIFSGTPLPKGHGRLIDANDVDNHIIGSVDLRDCPTIVEADKK